MKNEVLISSSVGQLSQTSSCESGDKLDAFEAYLKQTGRGNRTSHEYRHAVRRYFDDTADMVTMSPAMRWLKWEKSAAAKKMTGQALRVYEKFLEECYPDEDFQAGVPARLKSPIRPNPQPISKENIRKLHRMAKKILPKNSAFSLRVWMQLLDEIGSRRSGGAGVGWNDINWTDASVILHTKGQKIQELPISRKLVRMFEVLRRRSAVSPWIGAHGQVLGAAGLAYLFKEVAKACGLGHLKCHHFRHTRLTAIGNDPNFNPILFQAISGHADMNTAKFYVLPAMNRLRAVLEQSQKR